MNGLLCALMVGTRCMMWHPKVYGDTISGYGHGEFVFDAKWNDFIGTWSYKECKFTHLAKIIARKNPGIEVFSTCTNSEIDAWEKVKQCAAMNTIEKYNDQECK